MIRNAKIEDLNEIMNIYSIAKKFLRDSGNYIQWKGNFPPKEMLENDIKKRQLYVCEDEKIYAVFALIFGEDPTYRVIENGSWLDDSEYATIHRVASNQTKKGIMKEIIAFSQEKINHLRIDTYVDNYIMRHLLEKYGFSERGIIYIYDGTPRIAYEFIK